MTNGIEGLRSRKKQRSSRQVPPPRHPRPDDDAEAGVDPGMPSAAPTLSAVPAPAPDDLPEPSVEPEFAGPVDSGPSTEQAPAAALSAPAAHSAVQQPRQADPVPSSWRPQVAAPPAPAAPSAVPAPAATPAPVPESVPFQASIPGPDLTIDWSDPMMHVESSTRVSVAHSVATRFKAVADQAGQPPQTELIMEAVNRQLTRLPTLVLARRPEERPQTSGFFLRRTAVKKPEPWVAIYVRPNAGEILALDRIQAWVTQVITAGHPGRKKVTRSEMVTAALDACYPAPKDPSGPA